MPPERLRQALTRNVSNPQRVIEVFQALKPELRQAVSAYGRYGGAVNGEVIRLDLLARGLLIKEEFGPSDYKKWRWKYNPLQVLADKLVLIGPRRTEFERYGWYEPDQTLKPFSNYELLPAMVDLAPAVPPHLRVPAISGTPAESFRRSSAEVALDLARVYALVAAGTVIKVNMGGEISATSMRSLNKLFPVEPDKTYPLPDQPELYLEILRENGIVNADKGRLQPNATAAARCFGLSAAGQAHAWARGWLQTKYWVDGSGMGPSFESYDGGDVESPTMVRRQVLAWALAALAHQENQWWDLGEFLNRLYELQGNALTVGPFNFAGASSYSGRGVVKNQGTTDDKIQWLSSQGNWHANALIVTLPALGLVERGMIGQGGKSPHCFRFTEVGRAVFGAPEVPLPPEGKGQPFLVVQPNFDVIAYVDDADAHAVGILGRLAESGPRSSGKVQTFRLTQKSMYHAQESGLEIQDILGYLREQAKSELPANVVQSLGDWATRRESMVVQKGVTILGFPSRSGRDDFVAKNKGIACGERFAIMPTAGKDKKIPAGFLAMDHGGQSRRTWLMDEYGVIEQLEPLDVVQSARLSRLGEKMTDGWRVTRQSIHAALSAGCKKDRLGLWLPDHLAKPMPNLMIAGLMAWLGEDNSGEMAEAVLLHLPNDFSFDAVAHSPRLQPYLKGYLSKHWLVVEKAKARELMTVLKDLGIAVKDELELGRGASGE